MVFTSPQQPYSAHEYVKQDWIRILTDPDPPEMARMLHVGQFATWPKVRNLPKQSSLTTHRFLVAHD
jgi:hypothetical protein